MHHLVQSIYSLADALVAMPETAPVAYKARARALAIWTMMSLPFGVFPVFLSQGLDVSSPISLSVLLGGAGMLSAVLYLRWRRDMDGASFIFLFSVSLGLGIAPFLTSNPDLAPLILLAVTPVFFGLIVDWKWCARYTVGLATYYGLLALWLIYFDLSYAVSAKHVIACGLAALGSGFSTVSYTHTTARTAQKLQRQAKEISDFVFNDPLTGALNRRAFEETCAAPRDEKSPASIALIDLDEFKRLNDRFGHNIGDKILAELSQRLQSVMPAKADTFRMGGDQFAVLILDEDRPSDELAIQLRSITAKPIDSPIGPVTVNCSIGLARSKTGTSDLKQLYRQADMALFEAKQRRQMTSLYTFDKALDQRRLRKSQLTERLKRAIQQGKIEVEFQPQFDMHAKRIIGFEALARWTDDAFGEVEAEEFIALAEDSGLIEELDRAVFAKAVHHAECWLREDQSLAVNMSGKTLLSPELEAFIAEKIVTSRLKPQQLQIEIKETQTLENLDTIKGSVRKLNELGLSFALDDFGIGYSSLRYLSKLPIRRLKIHKSIIQGSERPTNIKILHSILSLASHVKLELLVEGVETRAQMTLLRELGCTKIQGYYFSKPLPAEKCIDLLEGLSARRSNQDKTAA